MRAVWTVRTRVAGAFAVGALVAGALVSLAPVAGAQAAAATGTVHCRPYVQLPDSAQVGSWPLAITVSPSAPVAGTNVTVTVSAGGTVVNHGPSESAPGRYRFEASARIGGVTKHLLGPVNAATVPPGGSPMFPAASLPLVASGTVKLPMTAGAYPLVLEGLFFNDAATAETAESLQDAFDYWCNASTSPVSSPAAFQNPRASIVVGPRLRPDVTSISATSITIRSGNCQSSKVRTGWANTRGPYLLTGALAKVTKGGDVRDTAYVAQPSSSVLWCPYLDGAGRFVVGPTTVTYYDPDTFKYHTAIDGTTGSFHARYATKAKVTSSRAGSKVTLRLKGTRYKLGNGYVKYSPKATVQYKKNGKWKKLRTVRLASGKATVKVTKSSKRTYRVVFPRTSTMTAVTSKTTRR